MVRDQRVARSRNFAVAALLLASSFVAANPQPAKAAANPWPHTAVNGFSTPNGRGFFLTYADGSVDDVGDTEWSGDASTIVFGWSRCRRRGYSEWARVLARREGRRDFLIQAGRIPRKHGRRAHQSAGLLHGALELRQGILARRVTAGSSRSEMRLSTDRPARSDSINPSTASARVLPAGATDWSPRTAASSVLVTFASTEVFPAAACVSRTSSERHRRHQARGTGSQRPTGQCTRSATPRALPCTRHRCATSRP